MLLLTCRLINAARNGLTQEYAVMYYFRGHSVTTFLASEFYRTVIGPLSERDTTKLVWTAICCHPLVVLVACYARLKVELDARVGVLSKCDAPDDNTIRINYSRKTNKYRRIVVHPTWCHKLGSDGSGASSVPLHLDAKGVKGTTCTGFAHSKGRQCKNPTKCITGLCHEHSKHAFLFLLIQSLQTKNIL